MYFKKKSKKKINALKYLLLWLNLFYESLKMLKETKFKRGSTRL